MRTLYASIAYDGSRFHGFQAQPNTRTVQNELQRVAQDVLNHDLKILGISRTDAGVHARDQRIYLQGPFRIPAQRLGHVLNRHLPDMQINACTEAPMPAPKMAPRHSKNYCYHLRCKPHFPWQRPYAWCLDSPLPPLDTFRETLQLFEGTHDFQMFSKTDPTRKTTDFTRHIQQTRVESPAEGFYIVHMQGDGFLWMMIRFLIAYSLAFHEGRISLSLIQKYLNGQEKNMSQRPMIRPAPASGLYLHQTFVSLNENSEFAQTLESQLLFR